MSHFTPHKSTLLLCVNGDPDVLKLYRLILVGCGYAVAVASSGPAALDYVDCLRPDLVILDLDLLDTHCGEFSFQIKRLGSDVPLIVLSAHSSVVEDASHFLDVALHKTSSIQVLIEQVETLLCA